MKKYQELERQVEEIQKEIERLKKEEENGLPDKFNRAMAIKFLKNWDIGYLNVAFEWKGTPQGDTYWGEVYNQLVDSGNLDDQNIIQIQEWIIQSYQKQYGV
jgi:hypothetical protein